MEDSAHRAVAVVGVGAILPDAESAPAFWENVKNGRYSISEVSPERWDPTYYYDPDPRAPDKTYSKIGGFVRSYPWDPMGWKLVVPPRVSDAMEEAQKWAVACTRQALVDYGYPARGLNTERTAVILGNAMGGEMHYVTSFRINFPEFAKDLAKAPSFLSVSDAVRAAVTSEVRTSLGKRLPQITEDTMPGELSNCMAGRIANLFNFRGPNFVCDAACASAMAALSAAIEGLNNGDFDAVLTGGVDRNMGAATYVKFCKIGALSATGTRPFADGADGFVMGEGCALYLLKRLADAERDGDRIYAVVRGVGGSSDGKGKGITAPNPIGQRLAMERAWRKAGLDPQSVTLIEGHGTSTRVGDVVEVESLTEVIGTGLPAGSVALGSVKSNIGHLKAAAGAAGILKAIYALHEKVLPPSLNFHAPNPSIDFGRTPFYVNTELRPWERTVNGVRRCGISAFGFGGTNFHVILEDYEPGRLKDDRRSSVGVSAPAPARAQSLASSRPASLKSPLRGALLVGADNEAGLVARLRQVQQEAEAGHAPEPAPPQETDLRALCRVAIDYESSIELAEKAAKALRALETGKTGLWKSLRAQGVFRGQGPAPQVAFLFTGQGSQYANMLAGLREIEPEVREVFAEADRVMAPLLGKPLSQFVFVPADDQTATARAEEDLKQTAITQPAVLSTDVALARLLGKYGVVPDTVMGHSLGEYGALVAAGALPFADALEAVSARGREMTRVTVGDHGRMAAIFAPIPEVEQLLKGVPGYVVIANYNCLSQVVIGGASDSVETALAACATAGIHTVPLPVSHAFHTEIVAPASAPLRQVLERFHIAPPQIPVISNVSGEFYPMDPLARERILDLLARQVYSPVQFVKGMETLRAAGVRVFVEVGPKRALQGFVDDVFEKDAEVVSLHTNRPKGSDVAAFNQALCGLYAAGLGFGQVPERETVEVATQPTARMVAPAPPKAATPPAALKPRSLSGERYQELGRIFAEFLERGLSAYGSGGPAPVSGEPVVITGTGLGLPGLPRVFDDTNVSRILRGEQMITTIPEPLRRAMVGKNIVRLLKTDKGETRFEKINSLSDAIKLAARGGALDLEQEYGVAAERILALDTVTRLAIGAGIDALRDAGIPLVLNYKTTTLGTQLPDRFMLPEALRDETGVIFGSAFPGYDSFAEILTSYHDDNVRRERLAELQAVRTALLAAGGSIPSEVEKRIGDLQAQIEAKPYAFDRRFLFRVLAMGHSQFAEHIGARGPNTQINAACATTTQAIGLAEDWIRQGRCRRVIVVSADNVTSDNLMGWFGAGFLASGVAATDERVEDAALPFDRRRHGMLVGMGAAAIVVESADAARERGITPLCEVLSSITANSAFHGSRLDVKHIALVMESLMSQAETRHGIRRDEIAPETVFVSHETYTPARGGSASAEIFALRSVFGAVVDQIVIANTKGYTGHPMAVGIEDVVAIKVLETGIVPPVANIKEIDPELGPLNLSRGGSYPVRYALRLAAGFGSQISMALLRFVPSPDGRRHGPLDLGFEYRLHDRPAFERWLSALTGFASPQLEIVKRTLRVQDQGAPARPAPLTPPMPAPAAVAPKPAAVIATLAPAPTAAPVIVATPVAPATPPAEDAVRARILALVSEKTGYPPEMLALDLDLEADLGIDTVKQAELFTAVREEWSIPRDDTRKLRDYPTLTHVIGFVREMRPDLGAAPAAAPTLPVSSASPVSRVAAPPLITHGPADPVRDRILGLVTEKTGYPPDMLDLDLDLEADLGIDTVKQAELFTAVRDEWSIPRDDNRKLRDYPTLRHVVGFVHDMRPDLKPAAAPSPVPTPPAAPSAARTEPVRDKVLTLVAEKTGYPIDMLEMDLDLEADLGIDTVKQAELFASVREEWGIPRDDTRKLRDYPTLRHVVDFVYSTRPDLKPATMPVTYPPANVMAVAPAVVAPAPVGRPSPSAATPTPPVGGRDAVSDKVLTLVAEKTGYPVEMLEMDLDLEADLGIDTVKQAELFTSVREEWGIPRDDARKLRDYPTLRHVIEFVYSARPDLKADSLPAVPAASPKAPGPTPTQATPVAPARSLEAALALADRVPRRGVVPVLRPALTACKSTGVPIGRSSRILVMGDRGGVAKALARRLEKLEADVLLIEDAPTSDALRQQIEKWSVKGGIQGVYWLPALDHEGDLASLTVDDWREAVRVRLKLLFATMRTLFDQVAAPGTFLVAATRLGGLHGYDEAGAHAPLGGAVAGFTKAYKRERPDALVKVVDFEPSRKTAEFADLLIEETLKDPGVVEVGYRGGLRHSVALLERPAVDGKPGLALGKDTVFVVTGAAGSIVSAITTDLATASGGIFHLMDLIPEPDPRNPDLARFHSDRDGLKRDIFERLKQSGERATPALVEKQLAALERSVAALTAIDAVRRAGGTVHYHSCDLRDGDAVARALAQVRQGSGRVDVLIHAAGIEISRSLKDKEPREFDLVFDVKADGFFHLLKGVGDMPLQAAIVFSSIAGRFGNAGQTDYSSANDLLCKTVSSFRNTRPGTRGIAIDWTAWGDIGMATRGSIPKIMEAAGIEMLPAAAGIPVCRRELTAGGTSGEIVVAGRLGIMLQPLDSTGGIDPNAIAAKGPMTGQVVGCGINGEIVIDTALDPKVQPFLLDHQIDGTPVLPGVMGIESFAEAASLLLPDWHIGAIESVAFLAPFKFYRNEPRSIRLEVTLHPERDQLIAACRLTGSRQLPGQAEPQLTTHFTARVRLATTAVTAKRETVDVTRSKSVADAKDIYQIYFHGPAYRVIETAWRKDAQIVGLLQANLPPNHVPADRSVLANPRLIELCFQTAGLLEMTELGRMGLPLAVNRLTVFRPIEPSDGTRLYAFVSGGADGEGFEGRVVDEKGHLYLTLEGYRTVELPGGVTGEHLERLRSALA